MREDLSCLQGSGRQVYLGIRRSGEILKCLPRLQGAAVTHLQTIVFVQECGTRIDRSLDSFERRWKSTIWGTVL